MPLVSMQEVYQSFGFSQAEARNLAGDHAAAHGGMAVKGWVPDVDEDSLDDSYDPEEFGVDVLDMAEQARVRGDLKTCENTLLLCFIKSMTDPGLVVVKLRCLVRLGDLYRQKKDWEEGVRKCDAAYKIWEKQQWLADADRSIHPVSFLRKWAECCDRLGNSEEAAKHKAKAERFVGYWSDESD
ncbi:hypothetical protein FB45DRAFT_888959 [Roridomyces roridus]|uniref:Uncharacterized protein n=1 Tax=Roridomyces roridus TaxID=1738132 RepID=A0AAD7CK55_9AGAR|nr:hypothetical protein FB45DRAFT_888959 [Roridomyces roridus]